MKNLKTSITTALLVAGMLCTVSCSKDFYTKVNNNPNSPTTVTPATLLTNIEVSLAFTQGGDMALFACLFTQQTVGANRQANSYYHYVLGPNDPEYIWDDIYAATMENDRTLQQMAQTQGNNEYAGIADVIMAYSLQMTVDFWGKIPYSTAFQGSKDLQPTYDNDKNLYDTAITLCNKGIALLENPVAAPAVGGSVPSSDDVIYAGNEASWIAFANAIKARLFIHQTQAGSSAFINGTIAGNCDSAIACVNNTGALSGGYLNAQVTFGSSFYNSNPVYQFIANRGTDVQYGGSFLYDSMLTVADPRLPYYFDTNGVAANGAGSASLGANYGNPNSPVFLLNAEELCFIAAEANLKTGNAIAAQTAYTAGITASMNNFTGQGLSGASETAYLAGSQGTLPLSNSAALHQVALQEYFALYLNPEVWTLYRRTGSPTLAPVPASTGIIPIRMLYPNSEQTLNTNCPSGTSLNTPPIFWNM